MNEIKFRARNANIPRCWIYGYFVVEDGGNYIINDEGKFKVIAGTEGQYIGFKDKNGKEVYAKDMVIVPDAHVRDIKDPNQKLRIIKWNKEEAGFSFYWINHKKQTSGWTFNKNILLKSEVIGNMYEKSELPI